MGYGLLKGKRGIISGALDENSIAWKVAEKAHEERYRAFVANIETASVFAKEGEVVWQCRNCATFT